MKILDLFKLGKFLGKFMLKKYLHFIIPVLATLICSLFVLSSMDKKVADWFQRPLPSTVENQDVVMINVDDNAVSQIGTWPFSRDVYADSVVILRELGAESVVFDLSFIDKSQMKVDEQYITESLPFYVEDDFERINDEILSVMGGYADGSLKSKDAEDAASYLMDISETVKGNIQTNISHAVSSQDESLATALKFFGNSFLTLTFDHMSEPEAEEDAYLEQYIALDNVEVEKDTKTPLFQCLYIILYNISK